MLRVLGLIVLFSIGMLQGEEVNVTPETSTPRRIDVRRGFHPVKAIHRIHDGLVNGAIGLSSMGIEQPADPIDRTDAARPLFSENHPACTAVQLTALLGPNTK